MQDEKGRHPYLAKIWWVSLPVFIAGQSFAASQPAPGELGTPGVRYQPEVFWPLEGEDEVEFNRQLFKGALEDVDSHPLRSEQRKPDTVVKKKEQSPGHELEWIHQDEASSDRFAVPQEVHDQCKEVNPEHHYSGSARMASRSRGQYLCDQELVQKVQSAASSRCSAFGRRQHTCSWEPCHHCTSSPWIRGHYARQEACPVCTSNKRHIPKLLCHSYSDACEKNPTTITSAPAAWQDSSDIESCPDVSERKASVPCFACVSDEDICQHTSSSYQSAKSADPTELATEDSRPVNPLADRHIPPYLQNGPVLLTGEAAAPWDESSHLPWQTRLAHRKGARPTELEISLNHKRDLESVPKLLCEGCTIADASQGSTKEVSQRHGLNALIVTHRTEAPHLLAGFSLTPRTLTATASHEGRQGRSNHLLASSDTQLHPIQTANAQGKLAQYLPENDPRRTQTHGLSYLALTPRLTFTTNRDQFVGSESVAQRPFLTPHHPTIARAAFDGTGYESADDLSAWESLDFLSVQSTDPSDVFTPSTKNADHEPARKNSLSRKSFWRLATRNETGSASSDPLTPVPTEWREASVKEWLADHSAARENDSGMRNTLPQNWLAGEGSLPDLGNDAFSPVANHSLSRSQSTRPADNSVTSIGGQIDSKPSETVLTEQVATASTAARRSHPQYPTTHFITDPESTYHQDPSEFAKVDPQEASPEISMESWLAQYEAQEPSPEWLVQLLQSNSNPLTDGASLPDDLVSRELGWSEDSCSITSPCTLAAHEEDLFEEVEIEQTDELASSEDSCSITSPCTLATHAKDDVAEIEIAQMSATPQSTHRQQRESLFATGLPWSIALNRENTPVSSEIAMTKFSGEESTRSAREHLALVDAIDAQSSIQQATAENARDLGLGLAGMGREPKAKEAVASIAHKQGQIGETADTRDRSTLEQASVHLANASHVKPQSPRVAAGPISRLENHPVPSTLVGSYFADPVCSSVDGCSGSVYVGETKVPRFEDASEQALLAWVQPSPSAQKTNTESKWKPIPGFSANQQKTSLGSPGSTEILDHRFGYQEDSQPGKNSQTVVKSLRDGSYHVADTQPSPLLSTTNDHLEVSGLVSQQPGAPTDRLPPPIDTHGKSQVGVYVAAKKAERSALSFLPSLEDARVVSSNDIIAYPERGSSKASIALSEHKLETPSGAIENSEHRLGDTSRLDAVVVEAQRSPRKELQLGQKKNKPAPRPKGSAENDPFLIAVAPKGPVKTQNHDQLGQPRKYTPPPPSSYAASFLVDAALAAEPPESAVSDRSARYFTVGAPSSQNRAEEESPSREEQYRKRNGQQAVGVYIEDYEADIDGHPDAPAGLDPKTSAPTGLGVRRQGRVWDESGPWVEQQEQPSGQERYKEPIAEHIPSRRSNRHGPATSNWSEARGGPPTPPRQSRRGTDERGLDVSLQKKNQQFTTSYTYDFEEEGGFSTDSAARFSQSDEAGVFETEGSEPDEPVLIIEEVDSWADSTSQTEGEDAASAEWKEIAEQAPLEPPDSEFDSSGLIAQETTIDSGLTDEEVIIDDEDFEDEPEGFLINYRDVSINEYIKFVSTLTGKNFVFNPEELDFNITIISEEPTTSENIMAALLQELRIHGLSVMEQGNNIIIHKSNTRSPARILAEGQQDTGETQIITRVFQLDSIEAAKLDGIIRPMLSGEALVQFLPETNNLLVTDLATNVEKIAELIRTLDMPSVTFEIGQYVSKNNFVENLIPLAQEIIAPLSEGQTITFVPHLATNSVFIVATPQMVKQALAILERLDSLEGATQILSLEDLNKGVGRLIDADQQRLQDELRQQQEREERRQRGEVDFKEDFVETEADRGRRRRQLEEEQIFRDDGPDQVEFVDAVQEQIPEDHISQTKFFIHKLQFRSGEQLVDALVRVADSLRLSEKANIDLVNAINSIQWIEASNSVVVTGTPEALGHVKELIEEIDTPLRQVFLEMLILDTTVADTLSYSVEYDARFKGAQVGAGTSWSGNQPQTGTGSALSNALNSATGTTTTDGVTGLTEALIDPSTLLASFPGFNIGVIGRRIMKDGQFIKTMGGLVQSLRDDTEAEIVLNPKIIVEDNHEAEIFVGENVAYQTQNIVNDKGSVISQNYEFRDVGTLFRVRPNIGNNNIITLEIEQEVSREIQQQSGDSSGGGTGSSTTSPGPSTATSRTITKVHVPDGFFVVLSGMVRDEKQVQRRQVPCLGGLPIIGAVNSSRNKTLGKRNLMLFIRPQIIDSEWDFDELTRRQQNVYKDKGRRRPRWKYEADEGLEFLNLPRINDRCDDRCWLPGYTDDWGGTPGPGQRRRH